MSSLFPLLIETLSSSRVEGGYLSAFTDDHGLSLKAQTETIQDQDPAYQEICWWLCANQTIQVRQSIVWRVLIPFVDQVVAMTWIPTHCEWRCIIWFTFRSFISRQVFWEQKIKIIEQCFRRVAFNTLSIIIIFKLCEINVNLWTLCFVSYKKVHKSLPHLNPYLT